MAESTNDLVCSYVRHHVAAARGGADLFERVAGSAEGSAQAELAELAQAVAEDREELLLIADALDASRATPFQWAAAVGERIGRLKPNGSWWQRTALTDLIEMEMLSIAVEGKKRGWLALLEIAPNDPRLDAERLHRLVDRADDQLRRLRVLHSRSAAELTSTRPDEI